MDWTCNYQPECDQPARLLDTEDGKNYCDEHGNENHELVIMA